MLGEKNAAVLKSFLALTGSIRGAAAVKFINQIIEAPFLYVYAEFLDCPRLEELKDGEHKKHHDLLRLFAYGTCANYTANQAALPTLTPLMVKKLRHLTLATLAGKSKQIPYSLLLSQLELTNVRDLEDLVIEAVYGGVLKARIDQTNQLLHIQCAMGRDVEPSEVAALYEKLNGWSSVCLKSLIDLEQQVKAAQEAKTQHNENERTHQREVADLKKTLQIVSPPTDKPSSSNEEVKKSRLSKVKGLRGSGVGGSRVMF